MTNGDKIMNTEKDVRSMILLDNNRQLFDRKEFNLFKNNLQSENQRFSSFSPSTIKHQQGLDSQKGQFQNYNNNNEFLKSIDINKRNVLMNFLRQEK